MEVKANEEEVPYCDNCGEDKNLQYNGRYANGMDAVEIDSLIKTIDFILTPPSTK